MAKYKTDPMPEVDSGLIEVGNTVLFWDDKKQQQRGGTIEKITNNYFYIRCQRSIRRVPLNDLKLYLWQNKTMRLIVETPK